MTLATGLAMGGMRPVVALYSTFLQRAFDQTVHDVCQNDQPVAASRSIGRGWSGRTARATRACSRCPPSASCRTSSSPRQGRAGAAVPAADRARAGSAVRPALPARCGFRTRRRSSRRSWPSGQGEDAARGRDLLFVGFGPIVARAMEAAEALEAEGWSVGVINARFAKPLDRQLILDAARGKRLVVTFEESVVTGGFGSGVLELFEEARLADPAYRDVPVRDHRHPRRPLRGPRVRGGSPSRAPARCAGPGRPGPRDTGSDAGDAGPFGLRGRGQLVPRPAGPGESRVRAGCATIRT